jgi:hypothetical protein
MATICCSAAESRFTAAVASRRTPRDSSFLCAGEQVELLRDHGYARRLRVARRGERGRLATHLHGSFIRIVEAVHDLHECALSGAVLPDEGVYFAGTQVESDVFYRDHAPKTLGDPVEPEDGARLRRPCYPTATVG